MEKGRPPRKRARGSYSKLICLRCRERRIKCQLVDDGSVQPSTEPQPSSKACQRCWQQGLPCVVRRTTLGRPNPRAQQTVPTPPPSYSRAESRSPSPEPEDLVLLALDGARSTTSEETGDGTASAGPCPTGAHLYGIINRSLDLTSSLLTRDRRYASSIESLKGRQPRPIGEVLTAEIVGLLDHFLIWQRLYTPWLPPLLTLWEEATRSPNSPRRHSATVLLALMCSIAIDVPTNTLAPHRHLQIHLDCIAHASGNELMLRMPRDDYFLQILELTHSHRPLVPLGGQSAAAHSLSGNLYATFCHSMQQRLGLNTAANRLYALLQVNQQARKWDVEKLVMDILRWCSTTIWRIFQDLEEVNVSRSDVYGPVVELNTALSVAGDAIHRFGLHRCFFVYHMLRCNSDDVNTICDMTADWGKLQKLYEHVESHLALRAGRGNELQDGLARLFFSRGCTQEGLAIAQLVEIEQGRGHSNIIGLGMFYAIISGSQLIQCPLAHISESYTKFIDQEATQQNAAHAEFQPKTAIGEFLSHYGDEHVRQLEQRLTSFIHATTDLSLQCVPYAGPQRFTGTNILLACREIVENNAARIKLDGGLDQRVEMQCMLFEQAAKRLELMEAGGGTAEAIARGSVPTACAKLIRSLCKLMYDWAMKYGPGKGSGGPVPRSDYTSDNPCAANDIRTAQWPAPAGVMADGFYGGEEESFPTLDPAEVASLFTFDLYTAHLW